MMSKANSRQIGGDHYKGNIQHWDLMHPAYLLGCASKYVSRHKKKGGREDLEKAIHYCEKFEEAHPNGAGYWIVDEKSLVQWFEESEMDLAEILILHAMLIERNMPRTIGYIKKRITQCYSVPLTEENHYTERAEPDNTT